MIVAIETTGNVSSIGINDANVLGRSQQGDKTITLVRLTEAGLKLLSLQGVGSIQVSISIAGDLNRDGKVDGLDSTLWTQQDATSGLRVDINGDGVINNTDRQILYANYGWTANQAPVAIVAAGQQVLKTYTDLKTTGTLDKIAQDYEGDKVFWRVLSGHHGQATLAADGKTLLFTPEAGFAGAASITVQADDGYTASQPIELSINVSGAKLVLINISRLSALTLGSSQYLQATGDFEDEDGVALSADYLQFVSDNPDVLTVDATGLVTAKHSGQAIVHVSARGIEGVNAISVSLEGYTPELDDNGFEVDVYPKAISLPLLGQPEYGQLLANADGTYRYIPNTNYNGHDRFSYQVNDGQLNSAIVQVEIQLQAVNDEPVVQDLTLTMLEDSRQRLDVLAQGQDVDGDTLMVIAIEQPQHGRIEKDSAGDYWYVPAANYQGNDEFGFTLSDGQYQASASVLIHIQPVNDAPELSGQQLTGHEDQAISVNPLINATDVDGDPLTSRIVEQPEHGQLILQANGSYIYQPAANYHGTDSFKYQVSDGQLDSVIAEVIIQLAAVNDAPVLNGQILLGKEDQSITVDVLKTASDVDGDKLIAIIATQPKHGQLLLQADGTYSYQPVANYYGSDTFSYKVSDGVLDSAIVEVHIELSSVNDAPQLANQQLYTIEDQWTDFKPLASATDVDGDVLTTVIVSQPQHGQLIAQPDGTYQYVPAANYYGTDRFTYQVSDGELSSSVAEVLVNIQPVNDVPVLQGQQLIGFEDQAIVFNPLATAWDIDGDTLSSLIVEPPKHGTLILQANGSYSYQPVANYYGVDSFKYKVNDGKLDSAIVEVSIQLSAVNDAPVAQNSQITGLEDTVKVLQWSNFNVSDVDADALTITISSLPLEGVLQRFSNNQWVAVQLNDVFTQSMVEAGQLRFVSVLNASGSAGYLTAGYGNQKRHYAQFGYRVADAQLSSNTATISIDIEAVADAPQLSIGSNTTTRELFRTSWETAANPDKTSTLLEQSLLEGWKLISSGDCALFGDNGFEIWSSTDQMANAYGQLKTVNAKTGNGTNWLELNDAGLFNAQTLGIEREVQTTAGLNYNLSFDYAGRLGFGDCFTEITIYVDGKKLATYANTSGNDQLNWQNVAFSFVGNGQKQKIQIVTSASLTHIGGRGAMLDNIVLTETQALSQGKEDTAIALQSITAQLSDTDGSEHLNLAIGALPVGSLLTDGQHSFTATEAQRVANITSWNLSSLQFTPPAQFSGKLNLQVIATSIELANNSTATVTRNLEIVVTPVTDAAVINLQESGESVSRELVNTNWEETANSSWNKDSTAVIWPSLEGWSATNTQFLKMKGFEIWSKDDLMINAVGQRIAVKPASNSGTNWLHLQDGVNKTYQTLGIERGIDTIQGAIYTLQLNYAGDLGLANNKGIIDIYVDNQLIATYNNTSSNTELNWQALSFQFTGNGCARNIRIQLEGGTGVQGRGAMLDAIRIIETLPQQHDTLYAIAGQARRLPIIQAYSPDQDGSEQLKLQLAAIPKGVILTDGTRYFTASTDNASVDITSWDWQKLSITVPTSYCGDICLKVLATTTELATGSSVQTQRNLSIKVINGQAVATPAAVNPYVTTAAATPVTLDKPISVVGTVEVLSANTAIVLNVAARTGRLDDELTDQQQMQLQDDDWIHQLEQSAQQNWQQYLGGL